MRSYTPHELRVFLAAIDACLQGEFTITVIGGGALALAHGVDLNTTDIDTVEMDLVAIAEAVKRAEDATGLKIIVAGAAVADRPWNSDDRLLRVMPELKKLVVRALEKHDVALSKTVRGGQNDIIAIEELHRIAKLDRHVLVSRYLDEMSHAIGDRDRRDRNLLLLVEQLFGEIAADEVTAQIAAHRRRSAAGS